MSQTSTPRADARSRSTTAAPGTVAAPVAVAAVGPVTSGHGVSTVATAWCAGCQADSEFVAPHGLTDVDDDERACLQCGWAVLVAGPSGTGRVRAA